MKISWLIVIVCSGFYGCTLKAERKRSDISEVPVIKLEYCDTSITQNYVADIQAMKNVEIRARTNGYLENRYVDEGHAVKKGQLLFRLSNKEYLNDLSKAKANVSGAEAAAKIARLQMERVKVLVEKQVIVKSELDLAKARLEDALARVAEAKTAIDDAKTKINYLSVRAPFDGLIDRIPLKMGSLVNEGTLLTTISDNKQMYAYFDVSENEYLKYQKTINEGLSQNKSAALLLSDNSRYPYPGKIGAQETEFSDHTGSIAFRATFPNPDNILKHGASGKVQLVTSLDNKILVPQKSVVEIQDKTFVFVVQANNTVKLKSFEPQLRISGYYIVKSGLNPGDRIVYEGIQNIKDGSLIKPVSIAAELVLGK
jgi:membrane fusion protein (multidrug efflux system)